MADTVRALLAGHAPAAPAIGGPGRPWMSHGALANLADRTVTTLNALGLGRGDRVAVVLPNGPEMAAAFLALAGCCDVAPLNPAYREEECEFYLGDLGARLLVVAADAPDSAPALVVARRLGLGVARLLTPDDGPAGAFTLAAETSTPTARAARPGPSGPEDGALVLHTSGTTSRPKVVPLLNRNVAASARHIGAALALTAADRGLNVMPLFHIHGLIAGVTAALAHGGSVWCAPGFNALAAFGWMEAVRPTWYTAVPTMHQALLARAPRNRETIAALGLRFIRSSSSSLPAPVMAALEETFGCPVIESYGMTEACHQMTSNPLPPGLRKPGAVGLPAGPAVRLAAEDTDRLLGPDETGEVAISGPNVTPGYEANPEANAKSFFVAEGRRWFRTGDQGRLDADGHLHLTGRLKEIVNRGGEKISPLEIDAVLLRHPAVAQAVTFAVPHARLGEDVAAAVVPHEGAGVTEADLRGFAADHLASFKVPRTVLILEEIPKGATGKVQRIGLAGRLGLGTDAS